jgi:D-alanyl-D-alanine carboxypeptidase
VETPRRPDGWTGAATTHRDDRAGLDADVAFRIASVTKMMTATALLVLADQGRCRLDDPTGRHLPSDLVDRFRDSKGHPYGAAVTLRQLLDHTSGLPNFFSQPPILEAVRHGGGRRRFTPLDLVDLAVAGEPSTSPPGTARSYTDTGFLLAGLIIEALTSRPLQQAYRGSRRAARGGRLASAWPRSLTATSVTGNLTSANALTRLNHKLSPWH